MMPERNSIIICQQLNSSTKTAKDSDTIINTSNNWSTDINNRGKTLATEEGKKIASTRKCRSQGRPLSGSSSEVTVVTAGVGGSASTAVQWVATGAGVAACRVLPPPYHHPSQPPTPPPPPPSRPRPCHVPVNTWPSLPLHQTTLKKINL